MPLISGVQTDPRSSLFPLSITSLRSKANLSTSSSTEAILVDTYPLQKELSDSTTLASTNSSAKASKFSKFSDFNIKARVDVIPLPPPPSYHDLSMNGPVRSVSGSSWVTEGPTTVEEPMPKVKTGHAGFRAVTRHAGRGINTRRF